MAHLHEDRQDPLPADDDPRHRRHVDVTPQDDHQRQSRPQVRHGTGGGGEGRGGRVWQGRGDGVGQGRGRVGQGRWGGGRAELSRR